MSDRMSDDRLAELDQRITNGCDTYNCDCDNAPCGLEPSEARELLAEVKRLREQIDSSYQWAVQLGPEIRNHTIFVANSEAQARQLAETMVGRSPETYLIRRCSHTKHGWVTIEMLDHQDDPVA